MPGLCVGDEDAIAIHGGSDTGAERRPVQWSLIPYTDSPLVVVVSYSEGIVLSFPSTHRETDASPLGRTGDTAGRHLRRYLPSAPWTRSTGSTNPYGVRRRASSTLARLCGRRRFFSAENGRGAALVEIDPERQRRSSMAPSTEPGRVCRAAMPVPGRVRLAWRPRVDDQGQQASNNGSATEIVVRQ